MVNCGTTATWLADYLLAGIPSKVTGASLPRALVAPLSQHAWAECHHFLTRTSSLISLSWRCLTTSLTSRWATLSRHQSHYIRSTPTRVLLSHGRLLSTLADFWEGPFFFFYKSALSANNASVLKNPELRTKPDVPSSFIRITNDVRTNQNTDRSLWNITRQHHEANRTVYNILITRLPLHRKE